VLFDSDKVPDRRMKRGDDLGAICPLFGDGLLRVFDSERLVKPPIRPDGTVEVIEYLEHAHRPIPFREHAVPLIDVVPVFDTRLPKHLMYGFAPKYLQIQITKRHMRTFEAVARRRQARQFVNSPMASAPV
jgi:hypothetical protein